VDSVLRDHLGFFFRHQSHAENDTPRLYLNLSFCTFSRVTQIEGERREGARTPKTGQIFPFKAYPRKRLSILTCSEPA